MNRTTNVLRRETISNCTDSWYSLPGDVLNGPLLKKDARVTDIGRSNVSGGASELTVPTVSKQQHLDTHWDTVAPQRLHLFLYASCSLTLAVTDTQHHTANKLQQQVSASSNPSCSLVWEYHAGEFTTNLNSHEKRQQCFPKPCRSTWQLWSQFPFPQPWPSHQLSLQDNIMYMGPVHPGTH